MNQRLIQAIPLAELHDIKKWHVIHQADHPLEYELWDAVLAAWLMGWVGWLAIYLLEAWWAAPLCAVGMMAPRLYVTLRQHAHAHQRLRCDWLDRVH